MKKLKFMLDYQSEPIWLYDAKNEMIGPGIPEELVNDHEFVSLINDIMEEYDSLFENNKINFEYHGFTDAKKKRLFVKKLTTAIKMLKRKVGDKYVITVDRELFDI